MGREVSDKGVLRGLWLLGSGSVYEVWDEGMRFGLSGDTPRRVRDEIWLVKRGGEEYHMELVLHGNWRLGIPRYSGLVLIPLVI